MRKAFRIAGFCTLWISVVTAFFIIKEKLYTPPVIRGNPTSIKNYVVQRLNVALNKKRLGSAGIALIENGSITTEFGLGVSNIETNATVKTDQTLYLTSSLSKAVTTWGMMKLVQDGKISLDEPVLPYLKRWRFPGSEQYRDKVTIRQLLSHTAGFVDGYGHAGFLPGEKIQTIEESLLMPMDANIGQAHAATLAFEPGTGMSYSSAGYAVLQLLVEEITAKRFNDFMVDSVMVPLGMKKSNYDLDSIISQGREKELASNYDLDFKPHPYRRYANMAGVSLRSTVHDLALLVTAYYNNNPVLNKESIKEFSTSQPENSSSWGLGHTLYSKNEQGGYVIGHGGGSFPASGAEMRVNPATGDGIVILASGTQGLISEIADVWTYWETGKKKFDIRDVVRKSLIPAIVVMVLGIIGIIVWQSRKNNTNGKHASI